MVRIRIATDSDGCVRLVDIQGHSGLALRGSDPVCAAVSVLAKAYALTLTELQSHQLLGSLDQPGEFSLEMVAVGDLAHARAAGRMLLNGLESIQTEQADQIAIDRVEYTLGK